MMRDIIIPDAERACVPATRPDSEAASHSFWCRCEPCLRPGAAALKRNYALRLRRQKTKMSSAGSSGSAASS